jgi:hypothetical protein
MNTIRFNNQVMGFMLNKKNGEVSNFDDLKVNSLNTIKIYNPCKDYSYNACQNLIHYIINVWITEQELLSDEEYESLSQTIYTLIQDSLENSEK